MEALIRPAWISHAVDWALWLTLLAAALPLTEFLLLERHRNRINTWCDALTVRLDDVRPATFLGRWLRASRRAKLDQFLFALISILAIFGPAIAVSPFAFDGGFSGTGLVIVLLLVSLQALLWNQSTKVFRALAPMLFRVLAGAQTVGVFARRFAGFCIPGLLLIAAIGALASWLSNFVPVRGFWRIAFQFALYMYLGLVATWLVALLNGVITLGVALLVLAARVCVAGAQWFMWRVSLFPGGPLAALVVVMVTILGVLKAFVTG